MEDYEVHGVIGEGAHGIVLKARHKPTNDIVALKRLTLKSPKDGMSVQTFREIHSLQQLNDSHHIVRLREVFAHCLGFVLAFDFMPTDLGRLSQSKTLSVADAKSYLKQLLRGVAHMHEMHIIHRDLKPANLLVSPRGILKIGDFSLARLHLPDDPDTRPYTHTVATRWYRAPELLFGSKDYTEGVDLWAIGCMGAELLRGEVLFRGESDIDQIGTVFRSLGTPNEKTWPQWKDLPDAGKIAFPYFEPVPFSTLVHTSKEGLSFLSDFLLYNSAKRSSAKEALEHSYFREFPMPTSLSRLPKISVDAS